MDNPSDITKYPQRPLNSTSLDSSVSDTASSFAYLHKRTERLVAAIFLVTDLMSDNNPIRAKTREESVNVMSFIFSANDVLFEDSRRFVDKYTSFLLEILSLLEVAYLSDQISQMNFGVISSEIEKVIGVGDRLKKRIDARQSLSKSSRVVASELGADKKIEDMLTASSKLHMQLTEKGTFKGHAIRHRKAHVTDMSYSGIRKSDNVHSVQSGSSRRSKILEVLKGGQHLTIRDFLSVISGVSDKTIQRDLVSMVKSGVLAREGERRWSKYFIAANRTGNVTEGV